MQKRNFSNEMKLFFMNFREFGDRFFNYFYTNLSTPFREYLVKKNIELHKWKHPKLQQSFVSNCYARIWWLLLHFFPLGYKLYIVLTVKMHTSKVKHAQNQNRNRSWVSETPSLVKNPSRCFKEEVWIFIHDAWNGPDFWWTDAQ